MRLILQILAIVFVSSSAHAGSACQSAFLNPGDSHSAPTLQSIATGLALLSPEDQAFMIELSWGGPEQIAVEDAVAAEYRKNISGSFEKPQPFYNKMNQRVGGIAVFRNNLYAEGFYRAQAEPILNLMKTQPWLQWDSTKSIYEAHRGNPVAQLLKPFVKNGSVTLYRGLSRRDLASMIKARDGTEADREALFSEGRDALFFTPDKSQMQKWATEKVFVEITLKEAELSNIYGGIEFDYVEVAIPKEFALKLLKRFTVHKIK